MLPGKVAGITPFYLFGAYRTSPQEEPFMGFTTGCRGLEIAEWLARHAEPDASYVILDDEEDFLLQQASQLVRINPETGLTPVDVRKAFAVWAELSIGESEIGMWILST